MVVELAEGHSVKRLNMVGPDDSEFRSKNVAEGVSKLRIRILDIVPESGDYQHYTPGEYTLVAVSEDGNHSMSIQLEPTISLVEAKPFYSESKDAIANASISISNTGTAPTWIYDIAFRNAPNSEAGELGSNPGTPGVYLIQPAESTEMIIGPGETVEFVSSQRPFLLEDQSACDGGSYSGVVVAKTGTKREISEPIEVTFTSGVAAKETAASWERYLCESADVELLNDAQEGTDA